MSRQDAEVIPDQIEVEILYATDREITNSKVPKFYYGRQRGEMSYGVSKVTIETDHDRSEYVDSSLWGSPESESDRRFELTAVNQMEQEELFSYLSKRLEHSSDKSALVYIHGFSRSFERAARTTALLAYGLSYPGIPVLFSWSSNGSLATYSGDVNTLDWSTPHFTEFLQKLAARNDLETIHIIAHSLGNRAVVNALMEMLDDAEITENWKFGEIVLVAPDLDRDMFERDIAPVISQVKSRITLYVSSVDVPLLASKEVNLYPRVGDASIDPVIVDGIQTIDASEAANLITGHTYYRDTPEVLADLYHLINEQKDADERATVERVETPRGVYWKILEVSEP